MRKILAFGASISRQSINSQLAQFAAAQFENAQTELLDLNDYEMPIYSEDREQTSGIPEQAKRFYEKLGSADLLVISLAEHNGAYSTAFKNVFDWASRINFNTFQDKPMFLLATSTGARGGRTVLDIAANRFPYQGAKIKATFVLPNFADNFDPNQGILSPELKAEFDLAIKAAVN